MILISPKDVYGEKELKIRKRADRRKRNISYNKKVILHVINVSKMKNIKEDFITYYKKICNKINNL